MHQHHKLPGVDLGEQFLPQQGKQQHGQDKSRRHPNERERTVAHRHPQQAGVAVLHHLEPALEGAPPFDGAISVRRGSVEEARAGGRDHEHREGVGSGQGEDNGQGQGREEELADPGQEEHRREDDANTGRGDEDGRGDLHRPVARRLQRGLAHRQVAKGVLDDHDAVVHQDAGRHGEPAQGHRIDRLPGEVKGDERRQHRERQRDGNDQRRADAAQEDEDHQAGQERAEDPLALQAGDRLTGEDRLVHDHVHLDLAAVGHSPLDVRDRRLDPLHDLDRIGARLAIDRDVDGPLATDVDGVGLDGVRVFRFTHVPHVNRPAAARVNHPIAIDLVVVVADLGRAGRDEHVERADGVDHVHRGKMTRLELVPVHINQDAPQPAAIDCRGDDARRAGEEVADLEVSHIVKRGLVQGIAGERQQGERLRGRRVERHHHGRDGAGRQVVQVRDRQGGHLRHRSVRIDVRAEEILHHADADERPRLLPRDAVGLAGPALQAVRHIPLDDIRGHTGIKRQDLNGGRLELRQDVHRDARQRGQADHQDGESDHGDGIRIPECQTNQSHVVPPGVRGQGSVRPPVRALP